MVISRLAPGEALSISPLNRIIFPKLDPLHLGSFRVITEADTCRKYVLPKLDAAGWNDESLRRCLDSLRQLILLENFRKTV